MDAAPLGAALDAGHRVVLEIEDGQVEVAVAQVVAPSAHAVDLSDFLHPEHVHIELRGLVHVLRRDRDVPDLRHGDEPSLARKASTNPGILSGAMNTDGPIPGRSPASRTPQANNGETA